MWLATQIGFFSIVQKADGIHVRARVRDDLERLVEVAGVNYQIFATPEHDYPFRLIVSDLALTCIMDGLREGLDYDNFKDRIDTTGHQRSKSAAYHRLWSELQQTEGVKRAGGG